MGCRLKLLFLLMASCAVSSWAQNATTRVVLNTSVLTTTPPKPAVKKPSCWLEAEKRYYDEISYHLEERVKLIEMTIDLQGHPVDMLKQELKNVYNPYHWIRTTSGQGRRLLMLDDNYRYKSLSTLSIGVVNMEFNVTDNPARCLKGRGQEEILTIIRESFLRNFKNPLVETAGMVDLHDHICNTQIVTSGGSAEFKYRCCQKGSDGRMICHDLVPDNWVNLLVALIIIIKVLVVLHSPMFLPESLYRQKYVAGQYMYHVQGPPMTLKVAVTQYPDKFGDTNRTKTIRLSTLKNMEYFKAMVSNSPWCPEKVYEVHLKVVRIAVKGRRLLDSLSAPVTIMSMLYNNLLRCRIARLEPLKRCCGADVLGKFNPGLRKVTWHKCMKVFAQFSLFTLLATPWFIRAILYVAYEADDIARKTRVAHGMGLSVKFPASSVNLAPIHGLFLFVLIIFIIDSILYGVISAAMKEKFKCITRQCLRDMRERSRLTIVSWMTTLIVKPFKVFGIVGLVLFLPYLVFLVIITLPFIIFYIFPTINFCVRLLVHLVMFICPQRISEKFEEWSSTLTAVKKRLHTHEVTANENFVKKQQYTKNDVILQAVIVTMCLVTFWSVTLLLMEVISFFVEMAVYTFMGVVVNAEVTLQYITVILLVFMYSKNIFSRVSRQYQSYHKVIHKLLMAMAREEMEEVAKKEAFGQENTAFIVRDEDTAKESTTFSPKIRIKNHQPQWLTSGMLVFLDKYDTPLTPEKFFYKTIDLNYYRCPGPIYRSVGSAVWEFLRILVFLLFVFVVVMALGDAYQISATNQLLATVAGGFLPFIFRHIFTTTTAVEHIDTSNIQFKMELQKAINNFTQSWPVFDIIPVSVREWDEHEASNKPNENTPNPKKEQPPTASTSSTNSTQDAEGVKGTTLATNVSGSSTEGLGGASPGANAGGKDAAGTDGNGDEEFAQNESTMFLDKDIADVDIIVDVSTSKTRNANTSLRKDLEGGSVSMLDRRQMYMSSVEIV